MLLGNQFRKVFKKFWGIRAIRVAFFAGVVAAVISLLLPNRYTSKAIILPTESNANLSAIAGAAAAMGLGVGMGNNTMDQSYQAIIESRRLQDALLKETYEFKLAPFRLFPSRSCRMTLIEYFGSPNVDAAVRSLDSCLNVDRDLKTGVFTVTMVSKSPELSQQVVRRTVSLLNEFLTTQTRTSGGEKVRFTSERLKEARVSYDDAERDFRDFLMSNRNYLGSPDPEVRLKGARLEGDLLLRRQVLTTLTLNLEQALLEKKNDMPILNVVDEGNLPMEKSSPRRALLVIAAMIAAGIGLLAYEKREWIKTYLGRMEESPE